MTPEYDEVEIDHLEFDPINPRFPSTIDGSDEEAVLRFMLEDAGLIDLMRSIAAQGFFPGEPLLVSPGTLEGTWTVIEGNRRLAASKLLAYPELAPTRKTTVATVAAGSSPPSALPCLKFSSRNDILVHLGYRHVTGIKEWDPLAKARFLRQRFDELDGASDERFRELARSIGSRSDYVGRLLASLAVYENASQSGFFGIAGLSEATVEFSLISSVLAYANIVEYLGLSNSQDLDLAEINTARLEYLFRWVFERPEGQRKTILGESRNIKTLADVVADARAVAALEGGATLQTAAELLGGAKEFEVYIDNARQNLVLARDQIGGLSRSDRSLEMVDDVLEIVTELRESVASRLSGDE